MRIDESALEELASAVADGAPIDWIAAEAGATTPAIRAEVRKLSRLARISEYHAHLPDTRAGEDLHDSIRHEAGLNDDADSDAHIVRWGSLTIIDKVGQGSFGDVYRARDDRVGRDVALKLLRRKDSDAEGASHVIDEARLMAQVRHANITAVFGADRIDGRVGLWMEFIDGPTLEDELKSRGPFGEEDVRIALVQIAQALRAVHQADLIHGDVKAQNVMRAPDGHLLLTDFGTGRPAEATDVVNTPSVAGSPLYLAPELFRGNPPSVSADLYSLGVLAYHLATGSFPVQGKNLQELSEAHVSGRRTPLNDATPGFSPHLRSVIDRLIEPDPSQRFQDAGTLLRELTPVASGGLWPQLAWVGLAAALVSVIAVTAWSSRRSPGSPVASPTTAMSTPQIVPGPVEPTSAARAGNIGARLKPAPDDLPPVTSGSSRARQLYVEAAAVLNGPRPWNSADAEQILSAALKEDPSFASAHILMAWTIANRASIWKLPWSPPTRDAGLTRMLHHTDEAQRLAASASTVEQYFINGSAHEMRAMAAETSETRTEEYERARRAYEGLLRLAPNHRWVRHNLGNTYAGLNLWVEKGEFAVAASDARPDEFGPAWTAAEFLLRHDDPGRATSYAKRAASATDRDRSKAWLEAMLRMFAAHAAWVRSDVTAALAETELAGAELASIGDEKLRVNQTVMVTRMYITLGRLDAASRVSSESDHRERALILSQRGDRAALADFLRATYRVAGSRRGPVIQLLHVPSGLLEEARSSLSDTDATWMSAVRGQLALAEGSPSEAVAHFERAIGLDTRQGLSTRYADTLTAIDGLASAWHAQGNVSKAVSLLEERLGKKGETVLNASSGYAWISARAHLAELYRRSDRERDARAVEAQLLKLLTVADETHPLLVSLKARARLPR